MLLILRTSTSVGVDDGDRVGSGVGEWDSGGDSPWCDSTAVGGDALWWDSTAIDCAKVIMWITMIKQ